MVARRHVIFMVGDLPANALVEIDDCLQLLACRRLIPYIPIRECRAEQLPFNISHRAGQVGIDAKHLDPRT
jgi:hypothetical protein